MIVCPVCYNALLVLGERSYTYLHACTYVSALWKPAPWPGDLNHAHVHAYKQVSSFSLILQAIVKATSTSVTPAATVAGQVPLLHLSDAQHTMSMLSTLPWHCC